jgi:aryl-alcohol dehydrogenase-like predicted oxidoreductase
MEYKYLGKSQTKVSSVGIGGHYKAMEEGSYEERYAYVDREVAPRSKLIQRALEAGINYFDTTWRNEAALLGTILKQLGARDQAIVNGMVLGAFTGSKAAGQSVEDYFNHWLDERLPLMPDGHYNAFMVNAIEEGYNEAECERLVKVLAARQAQGDFDIPGFSCHDPFLARKVADRFPEFETVMVPYNFHNRRFEEAFASYTGSANIIAMKSLVWLEYGIPFCAINALPNFCENFGFDPAPAASTLAYRFIRSNPQITTVISAINAPEELENLILAGSGAFTSADDQLLRAYHHAISQDECVPLYLGALKYDNLRMNFFGAVNLSRSLGVKMPDIPLNLPDSQEQIHAYAAGLLDRVRASKYQRYLDLR